MSLEQLERVARNLRALGVSQVVLTGGEPLLRPDIVSIVRLFSRRGFLVRIQTNGGPHATEDLLVKCYDAGLDDISVSLDTLDAEKQDSICGAREVTQNALRVLRFCAEHFGDRGVVAANVVISKQNFEELPALIEFVHAQGVFFDPCIFSRIFSETGPAEGRATEFTLARYDPRTAERVFRRLFELVDANRRILTTRRTLEEFERYVKTGDCRWSCLAGELSFDVIPTGEIAPCCDTTDAAFASPIANIASPDFPTVYRSAEFREKCRKRRERCTGCLYGCYKDPRYLVSDWGVRIEALHKAFRFGKLLH